MKRRKHQGKRKWDGKKTKKHGKTEGRKIKRRRITKGNVIDREIRVKKKGGR